MSTTIDDVLYEQYLEEQSFNDLVFEKIDEQEWDNIRSYYLSTPNLFEPIQNSIALATELSKRKHFASSLIHSNIGIELIIRSLFIAPLLSGSVFNAFISEVLTTHILKGQDISKFDKVARLVIKEKATLDLENYKGKNIWLHLKQVRELRNKTLHSGGNVEESESDLALQTVKVLYEQAVVELLKVFKLERVGITVKKIDL